jgi:hypothetical protein
MSAFIPKRVYVDTSVFGGCFEPEFDEASNKFFESVRLGWFTIVVSPLTLAELATAPARVIELMNGIPDDRQEILTANDRVESLRDAYVKAGVVTAKSIGDAEHIAWASTYAVDAVVSWNFKHIVHMDRIRGYHSVNLRQGYPLVPIHTPLEVIPNAE